MGPTIIFDKSALEGLNPDEAVWLDNFFLSNITPVFFIETLADLEKEIRSGRTPEQVVGNLAYKTPERGKPNVHHKRLLEGELSGFGKVDMENGRPHISGGKTVELGGKTGVIFQPSPEEEAFSRWQKGEFLQLERSQAKQWRQGLSNINLQEFYDWFQMFFPIGKPRTLADVKKLVDFQINETDQEKVFVFGLTLIGAAISFQEEIIKRWRQEGRPKIKDFAPYFHHVFSVDLFFYIAIAADLIGRGRPSHKIDLSYIYYLPFCKIFTSNDKLHAEIIPHFIKENQTFISGTELKKGLGQVDVHFSAFPEDVKKRGIMSFAHYPPNEGDFIISSLYDKHMPSTWRENKSPSPQPENKFGKEIMDQIRKFEKEGKPVEGLNDLEQADNLVIKRMIRARKGKWDLFPPEVVNRRKNAEGDWEDIPNNNSTL